MAYEVVPSPNSTKLKLIVLAIIDMSNKNLQMLDILKRTRLLWIVINEILKKFKFDTLSI